MPSCVLRYCSNNSRNISKSQGVTFHQFPRPCQDTREPWIKFVQNNRSEATWLPTEYSRICSVHFNENDKYTTKTGRVYLKKSAVPVENPIKCGDLVLDPLSGSESSSNSIFDTPRKTVQNKKIRKESAPKKKPTGKLKKIQRQNIYLKKKCASYKTIVQNLKNKFGLNVNAKIDLTAKAEVIELHKSLMKNNKRSRHGLLYTAPVRKFALALHYYSPAAYKYVRKCYKNALLHPWTICRWYSKVNAEPGFTTEAFRALKLKFQSGANSNKPLLCSLVFNEMAIKRQKLFHNNHKLGAVNFGAGPMQGEEDETAATQALVFMLVALNENWKLPVGYFLTADLNAETKANLIKICLEKCHEVGVKVLSLTFDGCSANFSAAEILGCKVSDVRNLKTYFPHPCTGEKVCIFIDPCHVIKLIRNTFEKKRLLFDHNYNQIKWQLLINLNKLQHNEGLRFGNKLTPRHVNFRQQIMKVKLSTQLLSTSVAKALLLCDEVLNSRHFEDSSGTVNFITLINNFSDIMKSRQCHSYGFNRPVDSKSKCQIFSYLDKVKSFILGLKFRYQSRRIIKRRNQISRILIQISKKNIVDSANKIGFVGAIICIESLIKTLYNYIVEEKQMLSYISMYRISQDHLELFFGLIRRHGRYNNNPNILQFRAAYKETLNHLELRSSFAGNCIPLDNFSILNSTSINIINSTTCSSRFDDQPYEILKSTRLLTSNIEAENNCDIFATMLDHESFTCKSKLIVGYISGHVSRQLTKKLKCEDCIDILTTPNKLPHHSLITLKDMGGLCHSAEDVYIICLATEKVIRILIRQSGGSLASKYDFHYITINTLKHFIGKEVFANLKQHSWNQPSTLNHRIHLIRAVINQYTKIRLHQEAKADRSVDYYTKRQNLTKLILFHGN